MCGTATNRLAAIGNAVRRGDRSDAHRYTPGVILDRLPPLEVEGTATKETEREAVVVLVASTVLLVAFFYWGRPGFFFTSGIAGWAGDVASGVAPEDIGVGAYLWWGLASLVLRVGVPLALAYWLLRRLPGDYGFRVRGVMRHLPVYGLMYLVMLPLLVWASSFSSFLSYYPFYDRAAAGGSAFWLYELGYAFQFVGVEAFFRGFMTFGLARRVGALAIPIMTVPYTMIHFTKPVPEAFAAIGAGLILGYMALRSRSWVPGVFLHIAVALTMDLLVLARTGAVGNIL